MIDIETLNNEELEELRINVIQEQRNRRYLEDAPERANEMAKQYSEAVGRVEGAEWSQPTASYEAYPSGAEVTHNGSLWVSTTPANVWEPGVSGWRKITEDGTPAEWVQPTGAHDAYQSGERVLWDDVVWVSIIDGNVRSPADHSAGWTRENPAPVEPAPVPDPVVPEFVQPTGAHDAYNVGDQVLFNGQTLGVYNPGKYLLTYLVSGRVEASSMIELVSKYTLQTLRTQNAD